MPNVYPKLHNAMWPGLVGKEAGTDHPPISLDRMLELTAGANVNGQKFEGIDYFLFHPHTDPDASEDELRPKELTFLRGPDHVPMDLTSRDWQGSMSAFDKHAVGENPGTAQQAASCSALQDRGRRSRELLLSTTGVPGSPDCSCAGPRGGPALPGPFQRGEGPRCLVVLRVAGRTDSVP